MSEPDVIVVGAGPAGLAAAISATSYGLAPLILEKNVPGGHATEIPSYEQFPGHRVGTKGSDLIQVLVHRSQEAGVEIKLFEDALELQPSDGGHVVKTDSAGHRSRAVVLATGCRHEPLGIPGEKELRGRGVSYCAVCDGTFFKDGRVVVVGCDRRAAEVAAFLAGVAGEVTVVCQDRTVPVLEKGADGRIRIIEQAELKEIRGEANVQSVLIAEAGTDRTHEIATDGVFFQLEGRPNSDIARNAGVEVDGHGHILADHAGRTNIAGIYAIGDVTAGPLKMVVAALAQGAAAASDIFHALGDRQQ